jgi:hypothetical protein
MWRASVLDQARRALLLGIAAVACGFGAYHPTPPTAPADTNRARLFALSNAPLQRISADIYALGQVRLDKRKKLIRFPAVVNMSEGTVEYALVHSTGKVHESVLRTDVDPFQLHVARLLVGPPETLPGAGQSGVPRELIGPRIRMSVRWTIGGEQKEAPLEDCVLNTLTHAPMTRGEWVYSGSRVVEGTFLAQRDGSLVAIIADPDALLNNPRPGRDDDEIWRSNSALVPVVGTPVEVTIAFSYNPGHDNAIDLTRDTPRP